MKARLVVLLLLSMSFSAIAVLPDTARATTLYVGGAGPGNHTTIQGAIDAASPGDTVYVFSGAYYENVVVIKTLSLVGEDKNTTRIDPSLGFSAIAVTADWINITGFNITGASVGIEVFLSSHCYVEDNTISSNDDHGIRLRNSSDVMITNNTLSGNGVTGISIIRSNNTTIANNDISNGFFKPDGIYITRSNGGVISGNNISDYDQNIWVTQSSNYTITDNVFSAELSTLGFYVGYSTNFTIRQNVMTENGFYLDGDLPEHWTTHTIDVSNTANGKPVRYLKDKTGGTAQLDAGHVILANCSNMLVTGQHVSNSSVVVQLGFSSDNVISNNTARDNRMGIHLAYSDNNTIIGNNVTEDYFGIYVVRSEYNSIFHNLFLNNTWQAIDTESVSNSWDNGYPSGGNYWSDYSGIDNCSGPNQDSCPDPDGIGDTPYVIDADSQDNYPFMGPYELPATPPEITATYPFDGETQVLPEQPINVTFSKQMNITSIRWTTVPNIDLTPSWSQNDTFLSLSHSEYFVMMTVYTVTITEAKDIEGKDLVPGLDPNPWSFSIMSCSPYIESTDPYDAEVNVSLNRSILVEFSHVMDPLSLTWALNPQIELTASWTNENRILELSHSAYFKGNTEYTILIDVENKYGNPILPGPVPNPWTWTTEEVLPEPVPPSEPPNLQAVAGYRRVALTCDAPLDDGDLPVDNYVIYRGTTSGSLALLAEIGNETAHEDTGLTNGQIYFYRVSAKNAAGEGPYSNEVNATPYNSPPACNISSPAAGLTISGTFLVWGNASDPDAFVERIEIRIDDGIWVQANGTTSWSYPLNTSPLSEGNHSIHVRSFDGEDYSTEASVLVVVDKGVPPPPRDREETIFDQIWFWVGLIVVAVILTAIMILLWRRRKKETEEEPPI